jgi:hypothetical protein
VTSRSENAFLAYEAVLHTQGVMLGLQGPTRDYLSETLIFSGSAVKEVKINQSLISEEFRRATQTTPVPNLESSSAKTTKGGVSLSLNTKHYALMSYWRLEDFWIDWQVGNKVLMVKYEKGRN